SPVDVFSTSMKFPAVTNCPLEYSNYINGQFVPAGNFIEVLNPSTGEVLGQTPDSDENTVESAVQAARTAQPAWAKMPAVERAGYLTDLATLLRENVEKFRDILKIGRAHV